MLYELLGPFLTLNMMGTIKVTEYQSCSLSTQPQDLILPDLGTLRRVGYDLIYLFFRQTQIMNKRKRTNAPSRVLVLLSTHFGSPAAFPLPTPAEAGNS